MPIPSRFRNDLRGQLGSRAANLLTLDEAIAGGFATALPAFVRCGVLAHGLALLRCPDCDHWIAVGVLCKGRGFFPSCTGRRMAETAANRVDHVLPEQAPLRQWVFTVPFDLRARLAFDGKLLEPCGRCRMKQSCNAS